MLLRALMVIASLHTGLPVKETIPSLRTAPPVELACEARGFQNCEGIAFNYSVENLYAIYRADLKEIVMREGIKLDTVVGTAMLLHEMVHHLQKDSGRKYACRGAEEWEAYNTQIAFLRYNGVDPWLVMQTDEITLLVLTACGPT